MRLYEFAQENTIRTIATGLQSKLGRLQRVGGPSRVYQIEGSDQHGAIYVIGNSTSAIGIGWNKSKIVKTVYLWKGQFSTFRSPDYAIDINGYASPELMDEIVDMMHSQKMGEVNESREPVLEAKRTTESDFINMARKKFGSQANKLTWAQMIDLANENDVQVPTAFRFNSDYKVTLPNGRTDPHHWDLSDKSNPENDKEELEKELGAPVEPAAPVDPNYQAALDLAKAKEVTKLAGQNKVYLMGRKPNGAFFRIPGLDTYSAQLERVLTNQLEAHNPNRQNMEDQYEMLRDKVQLVAGGKSTFIKSLLITGGPSSGKSFNVMKEIRKLGLKEGTDYIVKKGRISVTSMYRTLIEQINGLVIFDDCDSVVEDKNGINMLKGALDTDPVREISYDVRGTINTAVMEPEARDEMINSISRILRGKPEAEDMAKFEKYLKKKKKKDDEAGEDEDDDVDVIPGEVNPKLFELQEFLTKHLPNKIDFKGRIIFISNMDESEWDSAILTRVFSVNMNFTSGEMLDYIDKIKSHISTPNLTDEQKQEVLDYLRGLWQSGKLKNQVNFRLVQNAFDTRLVGNWKKILNEM